MTCKWLFFLKFQGQARPEKSPGNGSFAALSGAAFCASAAAVFEWPLRGQTRAALSGAHDDIAHRLAGLDGFMRGDDLAETEGLRHVVDEFPALEHARDVGGCACA
jgi:hypothetical protein